MAFPLGGGGGKGASSTASDEYALAKPYDVSGPPTPDKMEQINEMLEALYNALISASTQITTIETRVEVVEDDDSGGDVVGPSSSTDGNIVTFDGTTGKQIQDSGTALNDILTGTTGVLRTASVSLSAGDLDTLRDTPVTVASAAGAGTVLVPVRLAVKTILTTAGYTSAPKYYLIHTGQTNQLTTSVGGGFTSPSPLTTWAAVGPLSGIAMNTSTSPENVGLQVTFDVDLTGSGVATAEVQVWYVVFSV